MPSCDDLSIPPTPGRVGCTLEGAGKRRIFAIGNYVNQRLLKPVHLWFASVLRSIQMDGTFNQTKPLVRLVPSYTCFSYDLKSAYGSWPIFAFTRHLLVWWAAEQVRPGIRFDKYAVLGDDVLITDPLVAEQSRLGLQRLGVKISPSKSLISSTRS